MKTKTGTVILAPNPSCLLNTNGLNGMARGGYPEVAELKEPVRGFYGYMEATHPYSQELLRSNNNKVEYNSTSYAAAARSLQSSSHLHWSQLQIHGRSLAEDPLRTNSFQMEFSHQPPAMNFRSVDEVIEVRDTYHDGQDDEEVIDDKGNDLAQKSTKARILVMGDRVLEKVNPKPGTFVHIESDLDFGNALDVAKHMPEITNLKSVVLHCGFKHSKKKIDDSFRKLVKKTINGLDELYPEANIYISAVLPYRGGKNEARVDSINEVIEEICDETSADFVNFTDALVDKKNGRLMNTLYSDTVCLNAEGTWRIEKLMAKELALVPKKL